MSAEPGPTATNTGAYGVAWDDLTDLLQEANEDLEERDIWEPSKRDATRTAVIRGRRAGIAVTDSLEDHREQEIFWAERLLARLQEADRHAAISRDEVRHLEDLVYEKLFEHGLSEPVRRRGEKRG